MRLFTRCTSRGPDAQDSGPSKPATHGMAYPHGVLITDGVRAGAGQNRGAGVYTLREDRGERRLAGMTFGRFGSRQGAP